jgi:hypothetical protein
LLTHAASHDVHCYADALNMWVAISFRIGQSVRVRLLRWYRNGWLRDGTPGDQRRPANSLAHPIFTVLVLATLFFGIYWVLWIRSTATGQLFRLSVEALIWGIFTFFVLRWRYRSQHKKPGPLTSA